MASRRVTSRIHWALVGLIAVGATASVAEAQTDARLVAAVKLAQDGFADSARAVIRRLQDAAQPADSIYAEILYTAGLVAATDAERRLALRRVIVEYSQSAWADDALLLLGQTEYANGNPGATVVQIDKLVNDYPTSPLLAVGALWGARAASDLGNPATACRMATAGLAAPNDDIELKNQLEYQKQRCAALVVAKAADSAATPQPAAALPSKDHRRTPKSAPSKQAPNNPAPKGSFTVQIVAAPNQMKADLDVASLKRAGFDGFVVQEGGYFKVRAGPFAARAEAQQALAKIRAQLGGKPFIVVTK